MPPKKKAVRTKRPSLPKPSKLTTKTTPQAPETYRHPEATSPLRPEVGTQSQFRKKKPPVTYRYDSSLSPSMEWDGQNPAREQGEQFIKEILDAKNIEEAKAAASKLKAISKPFLNWAGKAERLSFDVPTLPLFVHERLSTKAIIETLQGHKKDQQIDFFDLFGDPQRSVADQVLKAYEYQDKWVNRLILGDSLVVMNSLLEYEGMGGQVQMIYIDPPYGVKFGSNFQPFVRRRDVSHNDDEDMTREPEMVKAYRDTWEVGLHSYLSYMRDRLLLSRELLHQTGSIFVQIGPENLHHVRQLLDEIFGSENEMATIPFIKTAGKGGRYLDTINDFLLWYAKDATCVKYRQLYQNRSKKTMDTAYNWIEFPDGTYRKLTKQEIEGEADTPEGRRFVSGAMISQSGGENSAFPVKLDGKTYVPSPGTYWKTNAEGMENLKRAGRLLGIGNTLVYKRYAEDFPCVAVTNWWGDTKESTYATDKIYVVQTYSKVIERCMLMTTDPGDLLLDPTCGSGSSAYVAEQWGRRWVTIDTSRVPLALTRQRLLTATFPYYALKDEARGPSGGFIYERKVNAKGEEVGGIVPHVTLRSIAKNESGSEEVLVDRPTERAQVTRVAGPFCVEATIPTPIDVDGDGIEDTGTAEQHGSFVERMLEVLRKSPVIQIGGGKTVQFRNVRPPAKSLSLSAEATVDATAAGQKASLKDAVAEADEKNKGMLPLSQKLVALVFGPENGAVSERTVYEAAREAHAKSYTHLYVIGFAIQANARELVEKCEEAVGIPATYVQATPDLMMGDLLKNMRSSQIFSVCGLPEIAIARKKKKDEPDRYQVSLLGVDVFDPVTMDVKHMKGDDVPAWFLDTDYNGLVFHVSQAFFPRTGAWENLKKALKATYDESVWDHLAGTESAPFEPGEHKRVAVKVIDDRGNELLVVKDLSEAKS
jgi:adenine-specific DNA-methyltransferase